MSTLKTRKTKTEENKGGRTIWENKSVTLFNSKKHLNIIRFLDIIDE